MPVHLGHHSLSPSHLGMSLPFLKEYLYLHGDQKQSNEIQFY